MCARQLPLIDFAARRWRRHAANLPERGIVSRRLSIAVLSLAGIVGLSPRTAPEPFVLDSTGSTYPFVTRLQGTLERRGDSLHISITEGLVASQIPAEIGADGIVSNVAIAFGLGRQDGDGWVMEHDTEPQRVAVRLEPEHSTSVGPLHFLVTGLDTIPAGERWLVAQVQVDQHLPRVQAGILTSYACAERNLLGATEASRKRAEAMKAAYSTIC